MDTGNSMVIARGREVDGGGRGDGGINSSGQNTIKFQKSKKINL